MTNLTYKVKILLLNKGCCRIFNSFLGSKGLFQARPFQRFTCIEAPAFFYNSVTMGAHSQKPFHRDFYGDGISNFK